MFRDAPIGIRPQPSAARRRSEETWAAAREAYLGGSSAPEVCERFDVGLSALRQRAAGEGWRRSDQADPEPRPAVSEATPEDLDEDEPLDAAGMAELSRKRARRAMLEGKVREAQSWTKVHESWRKLAAEDADAAHRAALEMETAEQAFAKRAALRDYNDRLNALLRADDQARAVADEESNALDEADPSSDLHEVHDLHAAPATSSAETTLNRHQRRALAWVEAPKARYTARAPPPSLERG